MGLFRIQNVGAGAGIRTPDPRLKRRGQPEYSPTLTADSNSPSVPDRPIRRRYLLSESAVSELRLVAAVAAARRALTVLAAGLVIACSAPAPTAHASPTPTIPTPTASTRPTPDPEKFSAGILTWSPTSSELTGWAEEESGRDCPYAVAWVPLDPTDYTRGFDWLVVGVIHARTRVVWTGQLLDRNARPVSPPENPEVVVNCATPATPAP